MAILEVFFYLEVPHPPLFYLWILKLHPVSLLSFLPDSSFLLFQTVRQAFPPPSVCYKVEKLVWGLQLSVYVNRRDPDFSNMLASIGPSISLLSVMINPPPSPLAPLSLKPRPTEVRQPLLLCQASLSFSWSNVYIYDHSMPFKICNGYCENNRHIQATTLCTSGRNILSEPNRYNFAHDRVICSNFPRLLGTTKKQLSTFQNQMLMIFRVFVESVESSYCT